MRVQNKSSEKTRFDARLTVDQKQLFERASVLAGYSNLSEFVIRTVQKKAKEIIEERENIIASEKDAELFFDALMRTKTPGKAHKKAADKYMRSKK